MRNIGGAALAALLVSGCGSSSDGYPVPLQQAYQKLYNADFNTFRERFRCGKPLMIQKQGVTNDHITWRITTSGQSVGSFTVRLSADGPDHTKIDVEIPEASDGGEIYDGTKEIMRPALRQPLRMGAEEFVASTLQERPFSIEGMPRLKVNDLCFLQKEGPPTRSSGNDFNAQNGWGN